ncbi:MAG: peptidoglycan-binding domain-containing protein [Actinomycetota bacterium]
MRMFVAAIVLMLAVQPVRADVEGDGHRFAPGLAQSCISEIQRQLAQRRYYAGPADGRVSAATRAAIRDYQADVGLPVDGIADQAVLNMLNFGPKVAKGARVAADLPPAPPAPPPAVTDPGPEAGDPVKAQVAGLQRMLADKGYYRGGVDGELNAATIDAANRWRRDNGMAPPPPAPPAARDVPPPPQAAPRPAVTEERL